MSGSNRSLTKVIVRHLPTNLDEASFKTLIADYLPKIDYFFYVAGKRRIKATDRPSRAYLNFIDHASLQAFATQFEGHTFIDQKGSTISCQIEYSQSQSKPKKSNVEKLDPLSGTIEQDEHYKSFLAELASPAAIAPVDDAISIPKLTPLLQEIKLRDQLKFERKAAKRTKKQSKRKVLDNAAPAPSKRKRSRRSKQNKSAETQPKFGQVQILTSATAGATPSVEKPKRRRKNKPQKTPSAPNAPQNTPETSTASPAKPKRRRGAKPKTSAATEVSSSSANVS